jgi:glycosyltransferase involved in cell wall biosynthesis
MRIAFDHQAFCLQKTGGISRYFCRLAEQLKQTTQADQIGVFAPLYRNQYLRERANNLVHGYSVKDYPAKTAGLLVKANGWLAKQQIKGWKPDLVHETYFSQNGSAPKACPVVLTVFDMIPELEAIASQAKLGTGLTQRLELDSTKRAAVQRADHIICISQHTRSDLLTLYQVPEQKVSVVYLGCEAANEQSAAANTPINTSSDTKSTEATSIDTSTNTSTKDDTSRSRQSRPYLLYVGLREGYKNFEQLLRAIAQAPALLAEFEVLAFGGGAFTTAEQQIISTLGFKPTQVRQQAGDDTALNAAYQNAAAFVYPSAYEGFGLPPLEAMARNCPVISSNTSSMPEVIGSAGEYFDPQSIENISQAIEAVVFSEDRTQELIKLGRERVKRFTWQSCAQETRAIYQSVLNASSSTRMQ